MFFNRYSEAILGAIITASMLLMLFVIIPISVQLPRSNKILALSPDFWIKIIVWMALALGVSLIYQGIKSAKEPISDEDKASIEAKLNLRHPTKRSTYMVIIAIINLFLYYFLILWLGMVPASVIAFISFTLLCGERRLKIMLPLATLLPTGLYYFFLKVASIPMPLGIFE